MKNDNHDDNIFRNVDAVIDTGPFPRVNAIRDKIDRLLPLEKIMELIYYAIDNGMDRKDFSTSISIYQDNVEISFYPMKDARGGEGDD